MTIQPNMAQELRRVAEEFDRIADDLAAREPEFLHGETLEHSGSVERYADESGGEVEMEHNVVLACKDGPAKHFRIYGRSTPNTGHIISLPVNGRLVKARVIQSVDRIYAVELAKFESLAA